MSRMIYGMRLYCSYQVADKKEPPRLAGVSMSRTRRHGLLLRQLSTSYSSALLEADLYAPYSTIGSHPPVGLNC